MEKVSFNDKWRCWRSDRPENVFDVTLPHDAMLLDEKNAAAITGVNLGWIDAHDYTYEKKFLVPKVWENSCPVLYFEGVYHKATIFINGNRVAYHDYGYTGFFVDSSAFLRYGEENTVTVTVINSDQPNSRWYSGTGIYRPVWLFLLPKEHIKLHGIRITTIDIDQPKLRIELKTNTPGKVRIEILTKGIVETDIQLSANVLATLEGESDGRFEQEIALPGAKLWSPEYPYLYTCRVTFGKDVQEIDFGVRIVTCTEEKGFAINGERIIIRGACIHHDNGILGACNYPFADYRKIRLLRDNGYNAIRSAHNPCSEETLRACDELGVLVVDEYVDVWYIHKNRYDYASEVEQHYKEDLAAIVDRDYNHPSVALYSTGNEVSETAQPRGVELTRTLTNRFHELDGTRPVTCGINIFFNFLSYMGFGVYSDKKAEKEASAPSKKKAVGSEFFNNLAGFMGADFMKFGATLYPCDVKTRDAFANMDVAGYNYGIKRYKHDLKKYPHRLILGSETFCSDVYQFWELAKKNPRLIGDFVWAGMDYLGEVGVGSMEYPEYAPHSTNHVGWVSAGSGRLDLTGKALAEMSYTQVAFEQKDIAIGVIPVKYTRQKHSPSAWKMTTAVESWSWNGCNGMPAVVEVYARSHHVSLYINGKCIGTKRPKNNCIVTFKTRYYDGEVKAVSYDAQNHILAEKVMKTAGEKTVLTLRPELSEVKRDHDLCYIRLCFTDQDGEIKPLERAKITLSVEGGQLLGCGSACPFYELSYLGNVTDTYYGEALAVIRPGGGSQIVLAAKSCLGNACVTVPIR